jgi:hypothetical protein
VHELLLKRYMGVPMTLANVASVKELCKTNRYEKELEGAIKYWLRLLEIDETDPLLDAA